MTASLPRYGLAHKTPSAKCSANRKSTKKLCVLHVTQIHCFASNAIVCSMVSKETFLRFAWPFASQMLKVSVDIGDWTSSDGLYELPASFMCWACNLFLSWVGRDDYGKWISFHWRFVCDKPCSAGKRMNETSLIFRNVLKSKRRGDHRPDKPDEQQLAPANQKACLKTVQVVWTRQECLSFHLKHKSLVPKLKLEEQIRTCLEVTTCLGLSVPRNPLVPFQKHIRSLLKMWTTTVIKSLMTC